MANGNGTCKTAPNGKGFRPRTAIEWITLCTLLAGIVASLHSNFIKPYNHIIECRELLIKNENRISILEVDIKELEKKFWYFVNKGRN